MKYKIITYGCQMNIHDSEVISGVLEEKGYRPAKTLKESDVIVLNTCCIRENAERKVYGRISQLKLLKNKKHNLLIAITGCMIKQSHVVKHILKTILMLILYLASKMFINSQNLLKNPMKLILH